MKATFWFADNFSLVRFSVIWVRVCPLILQFGDHTCLLFLWAALITISLLSSCLPLYLWSVAIRRSLMFLLDLFFYVSWLKKQVSSKQWLLTFTRIFFVILNFSNFRTRIRIIAVWSSLFFNSFFLFFFDLLSFGLL